MATSLREAIDAARGGPPGVSSYPDPLGLRVQPVVPVETFVMVQDNDCHWYVVPASKQQEAARYFDAVDRYWADVDAPGDPPPEPPWLDRVGGSPSLVKSHEYRIGGRP